MSVSSGNSGVWAILGSKIGFFDILGDNGAANRTMHVEPIRMIFPSRDLSSFLWKDMTAPGAAIMVLPDLA